MLVGFADDTDDALAGGAVEPGAVTAVGLEAVACQVPGKVGGWGLLLVMTFTFLPGGTSGLASREACAPAPPGGAICRGLGGADEGGDVFGGLAGELGQHGCAGVGGDGDGG